MEAKIKAMEVKANGLQARNLIHLQDVVKAYGNKVVLDNIDLSIAKGEFVTVVGPSGCGKSTLLRLILGQERVTDGMLLINGKPVSRPDVDRGVVYQQYSIFPHLTVFENVVLGKTLSHGLSERIKLRKVFREEVMHYLDTVRLADSAHKYPYELSGGMMQRVAIAQAMIMKPKILLMDEPFSALDPGTRENLQVAVLKMWERENLTIMFITHDITEACYLGTRIIVLSQHYLDGRKDNGNRGAKIIHDIPLIRTALSTEVKAQPEFAKLVQTISNFTRDKQQLIHVTKFNLSHPDSFQTLTAEEIAGCEAEKKEEASAIDSCVVCAWRADCKKKTMRDPSTRCVEFARDLSLDVPKKE